MLVLKVFFVILLLSSSWAYIQYKYLSYRWKNGVCSLCQSKGKECKCL